MKGLYFRLALSGIRKNRRLYVPYLLTCIGMVMMSHILQSLSYAPALHAMAGGSQMELILSLGKLVVAVFAALFLVYTNSFLIRRRNREFGLYNVLGMDKNALSRVIFWENIIVAALGLSLGLFLGILLYKLAELALVNIIHGSVDYSFIVSPESVEFTLCIFLPIFALLLVKSLWQVRRARPLELLQSENAGEKPPRANYLLGLAGLALLAGAYYISATTTNPMQALMLFFVAVVMVIGATYLLMISGSVTLCRLLQRNTGYYYQKRHFVSVSSMVYRMKRNGAGLASICVLSTMVLVMISSTSSLYFGVEDTLQARYPDDSGFTVILEDLEAMDRERIEALRQTLDGAAAQGGGEAKNAVDFRCAQITGLLTEGAVDPDASKVDFDISLFENLRTITFIPQDDYNRAAGTELSLQPGQAMVSTLRCSYDRPEFQMGGVKLTIVGSLPWKLSVGEAMASIVSSIVLVVPDLEEIAPLEQLRDDKDRRMLEISWHYGCDFDAPQEQAIALHNLQKQALGELSQEKGVLKWSGECRAQDRADFYMMFGGLFFIGITLSAVFIAAAALIIYYKQICEGYEDQSRFAIMRKVGMTGEDIKKSVNSQILTVFFAPLLMAGMHLAFAFPTVWRLLQLFGVMNLRLVILVNIGALLVFCVFYVVIYKLTAGVYYRIVSGSERK